MDYQLIEYDIHAIEFWLGSLFFISTLKIKIKIKIK
jgi:hypothetical protein